MSSDGEAWAHLGSAIEKRIIELNLTQAEVQQRGGPSPAKVREIVNGRSSTLSPSKRRDLERALDWKHGSIDITLAGGEPQPMATNRDGKSLNDMVRSKEAANSIFQNRDRGADGKAVLGAVLREAVLRLALAADAADFAASELSDIYWEGNEPADFDGEEFEEVRDDVVDAVNDLVAIAEQLAEDEFGGKKPLATAKQAWRAQHRAHSRTPRPRRHTYYRSPKRRVGYARPVAPAPVPDDIQREQDVVDYENSPDYEYDRVARTAPGLTDEERLHVAQDEAGEAPDPEAPEGGV